MAKLPEHVRGFDDVIKARSWLYDGVLSGLSSLFPMEDNEYKLELADINIDKKEHGLSEQRRALINLRNLSNPVSGTWKLTHKASNKIVDTREDTVLQVPYLTERGTFIHKGNEYAGVSQQRLRPGVYSRINNAGYPESFLNVATGSGSNLKIALDPATGVFKLNIKQSSIPLYHVLKNIGISDEKLLKAWGPVILENNIKTRDSQVLYKTYKNLAGMYAKPDKMTDSEYGQEIISLLSKTKLDPEVVARTLGIENANNITPEILLRTTNKLLGISRKDEEEDDREAPVNSHVYSYEDFIEDRIRHDAGRTAKSLFNRAKRMGSLKLFPFAALNPYTDGYILGSRLVSPLEETNPLHSYEQMNRIIRLGEGGIKSSEAITEAARDINPGQAGFIDYVAGPESSAIGTDVRVAYKTFKGRDKKLYSEFKNIETDKIELHSTDDIFNDLVAFPDADLSKPNNKVMAIKNGKQVFVTAKEIKYKIPSFSHMLSPNTNLSILPTSTTPSRLFYTAKYWTQFMPKVKGEVPLVDNIMPDDPDTTFSEYLGKKIGSFVSQASGTVIKSDDNEIIIQDKTGKKYKQELVKDLPFNRITSLTYSPTVRKGDIVKEGQLIANSNFTDSKTGSLTLGNNLRAAIMTGIGEGMGYDDAYVISESAAKKLATQRLYGFDAEAKHDVHIDKNEYISLFPGKFKREQIDKIDSNGLPKIGAILEYGDPIILSTGPKILTPEYAKLGKLHKALRTARTNKVQIWENDYPGVVIDANMAGKTAVVNIKADVPVKEGDKLTTPEALKGIVSRVISEDKMPQNAVTGLPYEILINPMGIPSRISPNQVYELQLAKIARHTGKQMRLPQTPPPEGWGKYIDNLLKQYGLKDTATVFDPQTGKQIKDIADGYSYIFAFHHLADKKLSERTGGAGGYTSSMTPAKGGFEGGGAKRFGTLNLYNILSHGAYPVIQDVVKIRGTKNEEFWKALKLGRPLPEPGVPFVYDKFVNLLKAGGINIRDKGNISELFPLTDKDIEELAPRTLTSSGSVNRNYEPINGGLFDMSKTGGLSGNLWSKIKLSSPMPNPVFEEPIRRLLDLRKQDLYDIISGDKELDGKTGGIAIKDALSKIDINKEIEKHKELVTRLKGSGRNNTIKILGYLAALKNNKLKPEDWVINSIPVIPPVFRPVTQMGNILLQSDLNELYRDVFETNRQIVDLQKEAPEISLSKEKGMLYDSLKAVFGLGDPITREGKAKGLSGAIEQVIGKGGGKFGLFQSEVISKPVDVVGRAVVAPDSNLDMDSVGIPEKSAWELYSPFIMRRLVRRGVPPERAIKLIKDKNDMARKAMVDEMQERPVIIDRAPAWHKFNMMAARPHLVKENIMYVSPLIGSGFNLDHDGDQQINEVLVNVLDKDIENYYITLRGYKKEWFNQRRVSMSYMSKMGLPYVEGGNYYIVNLEDFPFKKRALIAKKNHITFYEAEKFIKVIVYDDKKHELGLALVQGWSKHKDREVWIINLANGRQIISDDDERAVYGIKPNTIKLDRFNPSDSVGVLVPSVRSLCDIKATNFDTLEYIAGFGKLKDKILLTKEVGYVIGALAGDGWYDFANCSFKAVNLAGIEKEIIDQYKKYLPHIFKEMPHVGYRESKNSYGKSEKWIISSVDFASWVAPLIGKKAKNKHLPPFWFSASREFKIGLLSGLLDTDGCISINKSLDKERLCCNISSTSIRLLQELQHMLLTLGVKSKISFCKKTSAGNDFWILYPSVVDIYKLKDELNIVHKKNLQAINTCKPNDKSSSTLKSDLVPITEEIIDSVKSKVLSSDKSLYAILSKSRRGHITRDAAKRIINMCSDVNNEWKAIVKNEDVTWVPVESVENTGIKETGYDLTVPGYETFMSVDGVILSNTMNFHVPVSDKAVKAAYDKMLPSKNLYSLTDLRSMRYTPGKETLIGMYLLTKDQSKKAPKAFNSVEEAKIAYKRGEIAANDPIIIKKQ